LFEKDAIVLKNNSTSFVKVYKNAEFQYKVSFKDFPFLGIWTKKNAPFICIEPWLGIADSENSTGNIFNKEGIQILEKDKEYSASFSVELY